MCFAIKFVQYLCSWWQSSLSLQSKFHLFSLQEIRLLKKDKAPIYRNYVPWRICWVWRVCSHHPTPLCHWHGSWTGVWWAEAGSWESRPRGGEPPAAAAHATKSHHIFLHSRTFPYIPAHFPTFPHIFLRIFRFEQNATVHDARVVVWERFIVLSLWRAGQSYKILHNPSPICVSRNPTALCRNPTFSCNSLKFGKTCWKGLKRVETEAKPCWHTESQERERGRGANILQVSTYIRSHTFDNPRIVF